MNYFGNVYVDNLDEHNIELWLRIFQCLNTSPAVEETLSCSASVRPIWIEAFTTLLKAREDDKADITDAWLAFQEKGKFINSLYSAGQAALVASADNDLTSYTTDFGDFFCYKIGPNSMPALGYMLVICL